MAIEDGFSEIDPDFDEIMEGVSWAACLMQSIKAGCLMADELEVIMECGPEALKDAIEARLGVKGAYDCRRAARNGALGSKEIAEVLTYAFLEPRGRVN